MTDEKKVLPKTMPPTAEREEETPRKRRRHGYRGYPLRKGSEGMHIGTGFSGVEPLGGGGATLPKADILTEESTRHTR
jgi:hypothetical protein